MHARKTNIEKLLRKLDIVNYAISEIIVLVVKKTFSWYDYDFVRQCIMHCLVLITIVQDNNS